MKMIITSVNSEKEAPDEKILSYAIEIIPKKNKNKLQIALQGGYRFV